MNMQTEFFEPEFKLIPLKRDDSNDFEIRVTNQSESPTKLSVTENAKLTLDRIEKFRICEKQTESLFLKCKDKVKEKEIVTFMGLVQNKVSFLVN